ncbi:hypothetical protein OG948_12585 [Embleya sp. NBC_00888]|uniref:hypothetical protein n=1 Tax=Embleya sp. NBC_00888 TaxID=2975960 RepID=UPI00386DEB1E|nr:hypothetical protein OG948_12585 [Embleya sp. NBC_00888]
MEFVTVSTGAAVVRSTGFLRNQWNRRKPLRVKFDRVIPGDWKLALDSADSLADIPKESHSSSDMYRYLAERGAYDFRESRARLSIQNRSNRACVIREIRVVKTRVSSPISGVRVRHPPAGAVDFIFLSFDLDSPSPNAWECSYEGVRRQIGDVPYFDKRIIQLMPGEACELIVIGSTEAASCEWHLEIIFDVQNKRKCLSLDNKDQMIKTSGVPLSGFEADLHWTWWKGPDARFEQIDG